MNTTFNLALLTCLLPLSSAHALGWERAQNNTEAGVPDPLCAQDGAGTDDEALLHALFDGAWHSSQPQPSTKKIPSKQAPAPQAATITQEPIKRVKEEKTAEQKQAELEQAQQRVEVAQNELDATRHAQRNNSFFVAGEAALAGALFAFGAYEQVQDRSALVIGAFLISVGGLAVDAYRRLFYKHPELHTTLSEQQQELSDAQIEQYKVERAQKRERYAEELKSPRAY